MALKAVVICVLIIGTDIAVDVGSLAAFTVTIALEKTDKNIEKDRKCSTSFALTEYENNLSCCFRINF
jgi:hypothetical protein